MSLSKKFLISSLYNAFEKVLRIAINFIIFILMSNTLSIQDMGQYNFLLTTFSILSVLASVGLTENATKVFIDNKANIDVFHVLVSFKLLFSVVFASVGYFWLLDENIYFVLGLIFSSLSLSMQFLESLALGKLILKANVFILLIASSIKIWACITSQELSVFCQIFAIEILLQSVVLYLISYLEARKNDKSDSLLNIVKGLKYKSFLYIWISAVLSILYSKVDLFFVKFYLNENQVGLYTFATRIIDYGMLFPSLILSSLMGYLYVVDKERRESIFSLAIVIGILLIMAVNVLTLGLSMYFLPQYADSLAIVLILSMGIPFALLRVLTGKFLIIDEIDAPFLYRALCLLFVNTTLCFILIGQLGLYGAALANMITMIISGFLIDSIHKDTANFLKLKYYSFLKLKHPKKLLVTLKKLR